jgi:hypothetical protein
MEEREHNEDNSTREPELFYHYTDQNGLLGIIDSKSIWATHSQFLNDLSEYRIVFDTLQKRIKTERGDNWSVLQSRFLRSSQMKGIFVSSFSHEKQADSLTMWRGYAAPIGGYSIGFDRFVLNVIANQLFTSGERGWVHLGKCLYVDPEDSNLAESLEKMVESAWNTPTNAAGHFPINIMEYVKVAALAKHIAFREENEWRIVIVVEEGPRSKRIKFRQGKSMVVPYMEFSWKDSGLPNPIRRVVVGPTPNNGEAVKAVEMRLERDGISLRSEDCPDGVEIVPSKIPYRNW